MKTSEFYNIEKDGITQGLLSTWRNCRQLAWIYLQGYSQKSGSLALTFGTIVHAILERVYGDLQKGKKSLPSRPELLAYIKLVEKDWEKENPRATKEELEQKEQCLLLVESIMPLYFQFWHKDKFLKWVGVEQEFNIPYQLKDGRKTRLRGKMDGVFKKNGIWLFETKAKSRIDEGALVDVLPLDFQNKFYLSALRKQHKLQPSGVKYNVVRRSQMEQRKDETAKKFSQRVAADITKRPDYYFLRFEISIDKQELDKFDQELEDQIKEFYDWWEEKIAHYSNPSQCETKYGRCWGLGICSGQGTNKYEKRKQVFRELEDY